MVDKGDKTGVVIAIVISLSIALWTVNFPIANSIYQSALSESIKSEMSQESFVYVWQVISYLSLWVAAMGYFITTEVRERIKFRRDEKSVREKIRPA